MTTATEIAGRRRSGLSRLIDTRRHSRPKLSRLILTAAGLASAVILLYWLTIWINPTRRGIGARWIAQRGLARPWIGHQAADVSRVAGDGKRAIADTNYESFRDDLRAHLARAGNRPVVLYLSAAGILDDPGAVLLRDDAGVLGAAAEGGAPQAALSMEDMLAVFKEAGDRFPAQSRFLIWDGGQVGSDRNLGVYGNGFLARLKSHLAENPVRRLVILCSCAPGQTSWSSEGDGRSVFGYFVEQGLAGRASGPAGLTVQSLSRYVRAQVEQWVRSHRQAEQTPLLIGDTTVDFQLPRPGKAAAAAKADPKLEEEAKAFQKRLEQAWLKHDEWLKRKPYRLAPRSWLRYQETLLRAERLYRAGDLGDAEAALGALPNLTLELSRVPAVEGSLSLLERQLADRPEPARKTELAGARANIVEAMDQLLGGDEATAPEAAAGGESPAAKPADGKTEPTKPAAEKAGSAKKEAEPASTPTKAKESGSLKSVPEAPAAKKKAASELSTKSITRRRKSESPLARLIVPDEERRPLYPEAQLVVWSDTYVSRGPDANAFRGSRGEALENAMRTRKLAEDAAGADERISRWIRPWVDEGDRSRRKAQDELFSTGATVNPNPEELELADESYQLALKNAETCARALDLVEQLSAELPYYGEWKARRLGRLEPGLDQPFVDLLASTAELARQIHAAPAPATGDDRSLAPIEQQVEAIRKQYTTVADAYRTLADDFRNHWDSGRFRDVDAALCVPLIPAENRMRLLERVRSLPVASSLSGTGSEAGSEGVDPSKSSDAPTSETLSGLVGRSSASDGGDGETTSDPGFWRAASALARLEIGLIEIGGASKEDLAAVRDAYDRATRKLASAPFVEFGEISERIRSLRRTRVALSAEKPAAGAPDDDLEARDRAVRVMPLADSSGRVDRVPEELQRYRRRDLATWLGQRLTEDFAGRHALAVLEKAKDSFGDSDALRNAIERAKLVARAGLSVETSAPKRSSIDELGTIPVSITIKADADVPPGDAVAFVSYDHSLPIAVLEDAAPRPDSVPGALVAIAKGKPISPVSFHVERSDSTPNPVTVRLEPGAFYRGRIFPKDMGASSLTVRLDPNKEGIDVVLRQSDRRVVKQFGDQFERHPGKGFLHPHSPLAYRLVINHSFTRQTNVWVKYGLEGKDETIVTRNDVKLEPGRPNDDVKDRVDTDLHEIPVATPRYLDVEIRKDNQNGRRLFKRRYPFRQILPSEYLRVQDGFDAEANMAYVDVWHLKSDPVNGPSELSVTLDSQTLSNVLDRGQAERWWRIYPEPPLPVRWRISVEQVPDAFKGKIETGVEPKKAEPPAQ